jgi:CBS domain-containing protein
VESDMAVTFPVKVEKLLRPHVPAVGSNTAADQVLRAMETNEIAWLPIVDGDRVVGCASQQEIVRHLASRGLHNRSVPIRNLASRSAICARLSDTVGSSASRLNGAGMMRVLVVDDDNRLAAIVLLGKPVTG